MSKARNPGSGIRFDAARRVLEDAIAERAFPAAVVEVGHTGQMLWRQAFGRLTFDAASAPASDDTIFDLASLTKVVSTTPLVMQQVERGVLALDPTGHIETDINMCTSLAGVFAAGDIRRHSVAQLAAAAGDGATAAISAFRYLTARDRPA